MPGPMGMANDPAAMEQAIAIAKLNWYVAVVQKARARERLNEALDNFINVDESKLEEADAVVEKAQEAFEAAREQYDQTRQLYEGLTGRPAERPPGF